ncbi:hypothetical protein [Asticcacaulis solisilvae]|uniref:hypothetical protein n=1 Tax=Asticcacaulis solisilvae TaxID=1217274 RepID=UPI003FD85828
MRALKTGRILTVAAAAAATVLSSCGGGGGGGAPGGSSSSSSSSSSSTAAASYSAQATIGLSSLSTSESAPTISAPVVLADGTLMVPTMVKSGAQWNLQVQAYDDHSAPVGTPISLQTANTSTFYMGTRTLVPLSGGGLVAVQSSMSSAYLVFRTVPYGGSAGSTDFNIAIQGGRQTFATLRNNTFLTVFNDALSPSGSHFSPYGQVFNTLTGAGGSYFAIPATSTTDHTDGSAAPLANGGFVVSWCDQCYSSSSTAPFTLYVQTYDETGVARIAPVSVATGSQANPMSDGQVFGLPGGGFGVIWNENTTTSGTNMSTKVRLRLYAADGTPSTSLLTLGGASETRQFRSVAVLTSGRIAVLWSTVTVSPLGRQLPDYRIDVLDASGNPVGASIGVAAPTDTSVSEGSLVARANGGMAVMWSETVLGFCLPCRQNLRLVDPR